MRKWVNNILVKETLLYSRKCNILRFNASYLNISVTSVFRDQIRDIFGTTRSVFLDPGGFRPFGIMQDAPRESASHRGSRNNVVVAVFIVSLLDHELLLHNSWYKQRQRGRERARQTKTRNIGNASRTRKDTGRLLKLWAGRITACSK